jgi:hypothetical protein
LLKQLVSLLNNPLPLVHLDLRDKLFLPFHEESPVPSLPKNVLIE